MWSSVAVLVALQSHVVAVRRLRTRDAVADLGSFEAFLWEPCAVEGELLPQEGQVRFGWGEAWTEATLPVGALCALSSFGGNDPAPGIQKQCECSPADDADAKVQRRNDLGSLWTRCATEGSSCACDADARVRFGMASRWVVSDPVGAAKSLQCKPSSFHGQDPNFGTTKECWCEQRHLAPPVKALKVAIVSVSRRPPDLKAWLKYHLEYAGVDHIFLQIEDTPDIQAFLNSLSAKSRERLTFWSDAEESVKTEGSGDSDKGQRPKDDYTTLQARQIATMSRARVMASKLGIDWLVHIDDDELLYSPTKRPVGQVLAGIPAVYWQAYIPNVEAVYKSSDVKSCFAETSEVNTNPYAFVSYANGKSAVRVGGRTDLIPAGPHQWKSSSGLDLSSVQLDREPFGAPVLVVHFESCPFSRWEDKYWELGNTSPDKLASIPFQFYRDSIARFQDCGRRSKDDAKAPAVAKPECTDAALRKLWSSYKTKENHLIRRQDIMPIDIPWKSILAATL